MLIQVGRKKFGLENNEDDNGENFDRFVLLYDIFIKARSYYLMNKLFFFIALLSGVAVLVWPSVAILADSLSLKTEFWKSAVVQTTVTAIAGFTFSIYSQYKKKQLFAESLMRFVIWTDDTFQSIKDVVIQEMEKIDRGFNFNKIVNKVGDAQKATDTPKNESANSPATAKNGNAD